MIEILEKNVNIIAKRFSEITLGTFEDWQQAIWNVWRRYGKVAIDEMIEAIIINENMELDIFSMYSLRMWIEKYENDPMIFEKLKTQ